ncbi:MAG: hypothetical protein Q4G68_09970 [Planctomycetia bacterium]|nr:hypothetical protein [Planctomycetia bacterium]
MKTLIHTIAKCAMCLLLIPAAFFAGCGPHDTRPTVTGMITFNGSPLDSGTIQFAQDNAAVYATQITMGKYELKADPGDYRVTITSMKITGTRDRNEFPGDTMQESIEEQIIPPDYNVNSTLRFTVPATGGTYDADLIAKTK